MKKTITIKLNEAIFNIDEDAYLALEKYLESIKKHYSTSEGEEIMSDIESGIAEKFSAFSGARKKSISLHEVQEAIRVMGTVEEIDDETGALPAKEEISKNEDEDIKEGDEGEKRHRLYRNPDDVIIAGVCSGISAYFSIDSVIVRLVFVALILADGLGILIYIVLWIVMPEARTSIQKLEMRGKPVNLKKIEQTVKEKTGVAAEKGRQALSSLGKHPETWRKILNFPIRVIEVAVNFFKKIFFIIGPLARITFGAGLVVSMFAAILGVLIAAEVMIFGVNSSFVSTDLPIAEIAAEEMYYVGVVSIFFVVLIPLVFLLMLGWTILRKRSVFRSVPTAILALLWIAAVASFVAAVIELGPLLNDLAIQLNAGNR